MPCPCIEDTMIAARPRRAPSLFGNLATNAAASDPGSVLERCRAIFRELGERMSLDLSRPIGG